MSQEKRKQQQLGNTLKKRFFGGFSSSTSNFYFTRPIKKSFSTKVETKKSSEIQKLKLKMIFTYCIYHISYLTTQKINQNGFGVSSCIKKFKIEADIK